MLHAGLAPDWDGAAFKRAAREVLLERDETNWVSLSRYSHRQHQKQPLDGFVGRGASGNRSPLFKYEHEWYLAAWCHWRDAMRDFLVSGNRFRQYEFTGETFRRRSEVDVDEYLHPSFGIEKGGEPLDVAIRFDAQEARYIRERTWPGEQGKEEHPDGGLTLYFRATDAPEILRWALKYGRHAEVLAPPELRQAARQEVRRMGEKHGR